MARERLTRFLAWRTSGKRDSVRASIMAFDEMWTYLGVRRGERRQYLWIWAAVVEEPNGVRWRLHEVGGREVLAFSRLLGWLPGVDRYETDAYPVLRVATARPACDRHGRSGEPDEGLRSKLRSKLNRLVRSAKGYRKRVEMLKHPLAIAFEECLNQSIKSINTAR